MQNMPLIGIYKIRVGGCCCAPPSSPPVVCGCGQSFPSPLIPGPGGNFAPETLARRITSKGKIFCDSGWRTLRHPKLCRWVQISSALQSITSLLPFSSSFFIMSALFVYLGLKLKIVRMMKTCLSHWIGMKFSFTKSAPKCRDEYLDTNYDDKDP